MFGRKDGKAVGDKIDYITRVTPYIMPKRDDSLCYMTLYFDEAPLTDYVREKRAEGVPMSSLSVVLACYVRMISQMPELNRFVVARKLYARNSLTISFVVVHETSRQNFEETTCKISFNPADTIYDVARKVDEEVTKIQKSTTDNKTAQVADALTKIPGLLSIGVPILMWMDRRGFMPKIVMEASPFHTSAFITNMASLRMPKLYHHIYNFGTCSQFFSIGEKEKKVEVDKDGNVVSKWVYPFGVVIDERIASGSFYAMGLRQMKKYMKDPHLLETPPEEIRWDCDVKY